MPMVMSMDMGTPWLDKPIKFENRFPYTCKLNSTTLCEYQQGYWRFWYEADHRYALPTVAFFLSTIIVFGLARFFVSLAPRRVTELGQIRKMTAVGRFLGYRAFHITFLGWNSAPLGVLALGVVGSIYFFSMTLGPKPYYWPNTPSINFGDSPPIATRSGWLSLACLPFVFATAGKSNLITLVTGVSHEKLQVFHRWIAYVFLVTALVHTFPFVVHNVQTGTIREQWDTSVFWWTGVVALIAQAWLTFASVSPLRNTSYEWFKFSHFVAAFVFVLFLFFHCDAMLSSWHYFLATGILFALSWLHRQGRIYFVHGINHRAELSLTENDWISVCIATKAKWHVGQHFFLRFLTWNTHAGSVHPFTACSLPSPTGDSELVFYIQPQTGFTAWLALRASTKMPIRVLLDGPYGGIDERKLVECQKQVVIAGGSGAGWMIPLVTHFARRRRQQRQDDEKVEARLDLVLATRNTETRRWFEQAVQTQLSSCGVSELPANVLRVRIFHTGAAAGDALSEMSKQSANNHGVARASSQMSIRYEEGRPDLADIIRSASASMDSGQLGVFVCGPSSMQTDVSRAVAAEQLEVIKRGGAQVYLHMEHFSWA